VWRKRFTAGTVVPLGDNGKIPDGTALMYTVAATPVTTMQPATDLRPTTSYRIDKAHVTGKDVRPDSVLDRACVTFQKNGNGNQVAWDIAPGVAGLYAIRVRYYHTALQKKTARLQVIAADGTLMHEELLEFYPVNEPKWKTVTGSTGTMINAGHYKVVITPVDGEGLSVRDLDVQ
jgi:hypothetical protein